jgi:hypothetical protein
MLNRETSPVRRKGPWGVWLARTTRGSLLLLLLGSSTVLAKSPERLLRESIALYEQGDFEGSLKALERAERSSPEARVLAQILLYRGINHAVMGMTDKAKHCFGLALKQDSSLSLDPDRFKRSIIDLFAAAKRPAQAKLTVQSKPEGAEVLFDGKVIGRTPLERAPVAAGAHHVSVRLSGYKEQGHPMMLVENNEELVGMTLEPLAKPVGGGASSGASRAPVLRPGTHPFAIDLSLGGSIYLRGDATEPFHHFKAAQAFSYHVSKTSRGFAIGFMVSESIKSGDLSTNIGPLPGTIFMLQMGPKLSWDFQPSSRLGLYLGPVLQLGWTYFTLSGDQILGFSANAFTVQPGFEVKLLLFDRLFFFFRPFSLDIIISTKEELHRDNDGLVFYYDLMGGLGFTL